MRRDDPAQARTLIEQHASSSGGEQRFMLIECLGIGLNDGGTAVLKGLDGHRSGKVRAMATQFRARLGQIGDDGANAT